MQRSIYNCSCVIVWQYKPSLFFSLPLCLSLSLSVSVCLSLSLSLSLSLYISLYISISLSISLSLFFSLSRRFFPFLGDILKLCLVHTNKLSLACSLFTPLSLSPSLAISLKYSVIHLSIDYIFSMHLFIILFKYVSIYFSSIYISPFPAYLTLRHVKWHLHIFNPMVMMMKFSHTISEHYTRYGKLY